MKPNVAAALVVVVLVAVGAFMFIRSDDSTETSNSNTQQTSSNEVIEKKEGQDTSKSNETDAMVKKDEETYTAAMVAEHGTKDDCWTIVEGMVYDITPYVPRHPGGDEILAACGSDGTSLFKSRTTEDGEKVGSGTPHSSNASKQLLGFLKGKLVN